MLNIVPVPLQAALGDKPSNATTTMASRYTTGGSQQAVPRQVLNNQTDDKEEQTKKNNQDQPFLIRQRGIPGNPPSTRQARCLCFTHRLKLTIPWRLTCLTLSRLPPPSPHAYVGIYLPLLLPWGYLPILVGDLIIGGRLFGAVVTYCCCFVIHRTSQGDGILYIEEHEHQIPQKRCLGQYVISAATVEELLELLELLVQVVCMCRHIVFGECQQPRLNLPCLPIFMQYDVEKTAKK